MGLSATNPNLRGIFSAVRQIKVPKAGELREPIQLVRSERKPVINPDGSNTYKFEQELTPYLKLWAKLWQYQGAYLDGQNVENNLSHFFIVRRFPEYQTKIQVRDFLIWGGSIFNIRGVRSIEDIQRPQVDGWKFILIMCDEYAEYTEEPRVELPDTGPVAGETPTAMDPDNPLWR